jgi:RNA polymerase sigma factor (sigma-70 family)
MYLTEIIEGCIACKPTHQRRLFEQYAPLLMTTCRRYASAGQPPEDLLQEAFIRVFHHINQYNPQRGNIEAWMKRIVINLAITNWRKHYKQDWSTSDLELLQVPDTMQADQHLHEEDLLAMIDRLPAGYKVVFNLFAVEGYSHQEIAAELGITESTSRSQLTHARRFLRDLLERRQQHLAYE